MDDARREKLSKRLTPIHLYKLTPKTNCGGCGFATCLAFATQVIVGQADLDLCPYLDRAALEPFRKGPAVPARRNQEVGSGQHRRQPGRNLQ
jgi:acetyl-CoA decarbonylase/synthase complex subunit gamma